MVPTVCLETLPYCVVSSAACSAMKDRIARRSFISSSSKPCSSATLNATLSTPSWTSFKSIMRESSSGPISETVARTGWPCSPNTSQNTVENRSGWKVRPISPARLTIKSLGSPTSEMPERSPLISAANTGTPARANPSAITCNETVFPVPVAPVTRPWRFASPSVSQTGCSPFPMKIFSSVSAILLSDVAIASPLRAHQGLNYPGTMILLHLASRLNPVNGIWGIGNLVHRDEIGRLRAFLPKVGANRRVRDNLPANFATALALLQHSSRDRR